MTKLNREQLAWAAGFFDGEGCTYQKRRKPAPRQPRGLHVLSLSIGQNHRWPLDHFQQAVGGVGTVRGPYHMAKHTAYTYATTTFETTQAVIAMLWTFLGPVKRQQAKQALQA